MVVRSLIAAGIIVCLTAADEPARIVPQGQRPADHRITDKPRDLNQYCPFTPPADLKSWNDRRQQLKRQLQVALGLWPMPPRGELNPIIHGSIERDEYTVEKVYFASLPGHYVTGNLYRPKKPGKHPAVLCPHGHWANGRMHDAGDKAAKKEIEQGAESWNESARYILQAKCAHLARMGCVVFHFDMLGYADSIKIPHRQGFMDPESLIWLQSQMGLQTWNCIRSLDFVFNLPDVDTTRIGCTGGSGGGTQTFILGALDDRVTAAFPAVMVSTGMQGGCTCENAPYLRTGTGNVEIAALFAPKPLGMTGANDWTIDIERKGLPELKSLYSLYNKPENVMAATFPQFGHNYNQVSREVMYNWFNTHFKLGLTGPIKEREFVSIPPKELSVFDKDHPRPSDEVGAEGVRRYWCELDRSRWMPKEQTTWNFDRSNLKHALEVMVHDRLPTVNDFESTKVSTVRVANVEIQEMRLTRRGRNEAVPAVKWTREDHDGTVIVWISPRGKVSLTDGAKPIPAVRKIQTGLASLIAVDVFGTGDSSAKPIVDPKYAGFTFGYNRPFVAEQVHDILTAVTYARSLPNTKRVHLVGFGEAGPWVVMARALCGDVVDRTAADLNRFRFENVKSNDDPMMLPGALKYGGMGSFIALCAPNSLLVHNHRGTGIGERATPAYKMLNSENNLKRESEKLSDEQVIEWLLKVE